MKLSRARFLSLGCLALACTLPAGRPVALSAQQGAPVAESRSKAPAMVFILRHAEKPLNDKDPNLTRQGFQRAQALPSLFLRQPGSATLPPLPRPAALFAAQTSRHSDRPIETLAPLAKALGLRIDHSFEDRETAALAKEILSGKYAGEVVLVCWHHGEIPNLAKALGAAAVPRRWDDTVFDRIWALQWVDGAARLTILPEKLLPGDSIQ